MSIAVAHLHFAYCTRPVLTDIGFRLPGAKLLAVLGPNGVGKTTLFRCILGLHRHYTGRILVDGADAKELDAASLAERVAYIPQVHGSAFGYTVFDMVLMGCRTGVFSLPGRAEEARAAEALNTLRIEHLAHKNYAHLSGGEQQLVLIARALAQKAKILIMDEPTASLDYGNQELVLSSVRALAEGGYTVLLSTHNPQHALWYADLVLALKDGRTAGFGAPEDVLTAERIESLYGVPVERIETDTGALIRPVRQGGRNRV